LIRSDTPVNLLVPVDKADTFQRNLETGSWIPGSLTPRKKASAPKRLPSASASASPASRSTTSFT